MAIAFFVVATAASVSAHPVPYTYLDLRLEDGAIDGVLVAHVFDVGHDLNVDPPEQLLDPAVLASRAPAVVALLAPRLAILADGVTLTAAWSAEVVPLVDRQSLRLHVRYAAPSTPGTLTVTAHFFPYDPNHQTFLNFSEGSALTQAILDDGRPRFEYYAGTRRGAFAVMRAFVPAGIMHVLAGPDHLVFLVGLLLLGGTIGHLVIVVSAFTAGHVLTLSLAALNLVAPPARLIEPAMALSLVYLGADNLLVSGPRGGRDVRVWIALAVGAIHGFGFAGVLRRADLSARALDWALVSFNAGLEIGQLIAVAVVVAMLAAVRTRGEIASRRLATVGSVAVIAAGAWWFVLRLW